MNHNYKRHFFLIGAQRCGTTFLLESINQSPDVKFATPFKPEPKFFLDNELFNSYSKEFYYEKYFKTLSDATYYGEKSTSYIENVEAIKNITTFFPDAKFIVSLRNPIDRAISNYFFSVNNKLENREIKNVFQGDLRDLQFDSRKISVNPFNYLERGKYIKYLRELSNVIDEKNILITFFEEFTTNLKYQNKIFEFLSINYSPIKVLPRKNSSKKTVLVSKEIRLNLKNYYRQYNLELSEYLKKDLSHWN